MNVTLVLNDMLLNNFMLFWLYSNMQWRTKRDMRTYCELFVFKYCVFVFHVTPEKIYSFSICFYPKRGANGKSTKKIRWATVLVIPQYQNSTQIEVRSKIAKEKRKMQNLNTQIASISQKNAKKIAWKPMLFWAFMAFMTCLSSCPQHEGLTVINSGGFNMFRCSSVIQGFSRSRCPKSGQLCKCQHFCP